MPNFTDYVLDLETSGKRAWHGIREKFNPPRITQVGMIKISPMDPTKFKAIIGGGPGSGWTNMIGPLVEKYRPLSADKLPPGFWRELASYDPSVTVKGSVLNTQVKANINEYIALRHSGQTGEMKTAVEYIRQFQAEIQGEINRGNVVRLHAYNKGFDVAQMVNEMNRAGEKEGRAFMHWLDDHVTRGRLQIKGVEESIHKGMFEVMLKDEKIVPRFASSRYFQMAREAGLKTVGIEATTPHYALRELMNDVKRIQGGTPIKQVLQGLPADVASELASVKSYDDFMNFTRFLESDPLAKQALMSHYRSKVVRKHGVQMGRHVAEMGFEYVSGWRQEVISQLLGDPRVHHKAFLDTITSQKIRLATADPTAAQNLARQVMTDESLIAAEVNRKYLALGQETTGASSVVEKTMKGLTRTAHRSRLPPPAGLSRLARSPLTLPIMAAAGGFILGEQLIQNATPVPRVKAIKEEIEGKIEGLRRATSQWDQFGGILPSRMPFANQSAFGSGRWDSVWASGQYKGVAIDPSIYYQRMHLNMNPQLAYQEQMQKARADVPSVYSPSREELSNRMIDISDYIYEIKDADSILLRKAWLNQNIPLIGPLLGAIQRQMMNMTKAGKEAGFEVRISGIDAPEIAHPEYGENWLGGQRGGEEASDKLRALMGGSPLQQILGGRATHIKLMPGRTFGRYVGVPMAGGKDIAAELVREGGAIALSAGGEESPYFGQEELAAGYGIGMWQYPEYQGILEARRRGIRPILSHLQKQTHLGRSLQAAATSSLMAYAANPQMHGVRDQYAQNLYVRGF